MIRIIKVKGRTGRFDTPSFLWTENETLTLKFEIAEARVGRYVAVVQCGTQKKTVYFSKNTTIDVLPEFIQKGEFNPVSVLLEFRTTQGDRVIISNDPAKGGFFIEPLYIERVEGNTTAIAWLTKIESELAELRTRQEETEKKLRQFEDEGVPIFSENEE